MSDTAEDPPSLIAYLLDRPHLILLALLLIGAVVINAGAWLLQRKADDLEQRLQALETRAAE